MQLSLQCIIYCTPYLVLDGLTVCCVEYSRQLLYPNHNAVFLFSKDETERLYYFVGRVLGKALFENLTVQPQFAHFFLSFINGKYNFMNLIDDLNTYDPELYKNLMFLKSFDGDIADLCLSFSVSEEAFGSQREVDLIPGASMSFAVPCFYASSAYPEPCVSPGRMV